MIETRSFKHLSCVAPILTIEEAWNMAVQYRRLEADKHTSARQERRSSERGSARRADALDASAARIGLLAQDLEQAIADFH